MRYDLFQADKDEGKRHCRSFLLWPRQWRGFAWKSKLVWKNVKAQKSEIKKLPDKPGVYVFAIAPSVAEMEFYGVVAYIGETKGSDQSLRKRCAVYFTNSEYEKRPHIGEMMSLLERCPSIVLHRDNDI